MITPLLTSAETNSVLSITTIVIPTLFAVIVLGLAALRFRSFPLLGRLSDNNGNSTRRRKMRLDELLPELQSFYKRSAFREGTIFIYQKLRPQIVEALNLSSLLTATERETVDHILSLPSTQNLKIDDDLRSLYSIYEEAKFSSHKSSKEELSQTANLYSSLWYSCSLGE